MKNTKFLVATLFFATIGLNTFGQPTKTPSTAKEYSGKPFTDSVYTKGIQQIPGKLQCEYYDIGGEGITFHDTDDKNSGSGGLNKGPGYQNNFRINEAVDISYTKYHDSIDNSIYSIVQPKVDQLYLGWTEPGEWTSYTVDVLETGNYKVGVMYTSNRGGAIRFVVDQTDSTSLLNIPSTFNEKEPIRWRNWHHWNYVDSLTTMHLTKGKKIIKLEISKEGNFNFDYFNFEKVEKK